MSGKARPSLRSKTLENVRYSTLSNTDKECIYEVFKRYEDILKENEQVKRERDAAVEIIRCNTDGCDFCRRAKWLDDVKCKNYQEDHACFEWRGLKGGAEGE